jgi:hypothetical protein
MIDNKTLRVLGVSAKIATGVIVAGVLFAAYRNYFEMRKTRLQIKFLKKQLAE